jgi:FkbM family methyltransferase
MSTKLWRIKGLLQTLTNSPKLNRKILNSFLSKMAKENCFFIEIGANDGIEGDPIYKFVKKFQLAGIYIEPQKKVFDKLVNNFRNFKNVHFENIAVSKQEGTIDLFIPKSTEQVKENITSLMASTSKDKGNLGYFGSFEIEQVESKPFSYLVDKYNLRAKKNIFLLIDIEGNEKELIESIDFTTCKPKYIFFEHVHMTYDSHLNLNNFLIALGYSIYFSRNDTLASLR